MSDDFDPDLANVRLHAAEVNADGVQALVDALQSYRTMVRQAFDYVDAQTAQAGGTTSIYRLKDHILAINARLSELQWRIDLDHVDLADLTNGQRQGTQT